MKQKLVIILACCLLLFALPSLALAADDDAFAPQNSVTTITPYFVFNILSTAPSFGDAYYILLGVGHSPTYTFAATGTGPISYAIAEQLPLGISFSGDTLSADQGSLVDSAQMITVTASDSGGSATRQFLLVTKANVGTTTITQITNAEFTDNSHTVAGGAIQLNSNTIAAVFEDCTFTNNSAPLGGAIYADGVAYTLFINCTFAGNTASTDGNAIYIDNGNAIFVNCTFGANDDVVVNGDIIAEAPTITGMLPLTGAIDVPIATSELELHFSERISAVAGKNIILAAGSSQITIAADTALISADGKTATFTLPATLKYRKNYTLTVEAGAFISKLHKTTAATTVGSFSTEAGTSGGGAGLATHTVSFNANGGSSIASQNIRQGNTATKPADPVREGYTFSGWYVDKSGTEPYDFASKVTKSFTLYAGWEAVAAAWDNPFSDIKASDWFYSNVEYVYLNGLLTGTSATTFSPQAPITRAMLVTILYRLADQPSPGNIANPFSDVAANQWYTNAVLWATANNLVKGYGNGIFAPHQPITRQDLAVILLRYLDFAKISITVTEEYRIFADEDEIADYAKNAIQIMNKIGVIEGIGADIINPQGHATRAEAAAMLQRFLFAIQNADTLA